VLLESGVIKHLFFLIAHLHFGQGG
jgi:hypothetical protein